MNRQQRRAAAAGKDPVIEAVSVYFQNDGDDGFSFRREFIGDTAGREFAGICEQLMVGYDAHQPALAIAYLKRIAAAPDKPARVIGSAQLITATVHWLERRGHIKSDEFNGVLWIGRRGTEAFGIRHDQPTLQHLNELIQVAPNTVLRGLGDKDFNAFVRDIFGTPPGN